MNIIFRSCEILWRWKETPAKVHKGCCEKPVFLSTWLAQLVSQTGEQICLIKWLRATEVWLRSVQLRDLKECVTALLALNR